MPLFTGMMFLLLITSGSFAQSLRYNISAPNLTLTAYSQKQADVYSFTGNQAALMKVRSVTAGIYGERRFLLSDNSAYTVAAAIPSSMGNFGVKINYSGFANFNEQAIGLAYARSLGNRVDIGAQFNYYSYRIPAYGNASSLNFELGALLHLTDRVNAGVHIYNPLGGKLGKSGDEKLAAAYKFGLGYDASDELFISLETIKEEGKPINASGGVQYQFQKQFLAKLGFVSQNGTVFAGAGVLWKQFRVDLSGSYHPQLGFSPGISLIGKFK